MRQVYGMEYVGDPATVKHCLTHIAYGGEEFCSVHVHTALINNSQVGRELNKQQWRLNYIWTQVKTTQYRVKIAMVSCKQVLVVS